MLVKSHTAARLARASFPLSLCVGLSTSGPLARNGFRSIASDPSACVSGPSGWNGPQGMCRVVDGRPAGRPVADATANCGGASKVRPCTLLVCSVGLGCAPVGREAHCTSGLASGPTLCWSSAPSRQTFCWLAIWHRVGGKDRGQLCRDGVSSPCLRKGTALSRHVN